MSSKYCMSCGFSNFSDANFCQKCGKSFNPSKEPKSRLEGSSTPRKQRMTAEDDDDDESGDLDYVPDVDKIEFEHEIIANETFHLGGFIKRLVDVVQGQEKK